MTIFHHELLTREWFRVIDELIHTTICLLIHKKYHPTNYHNDKKYHMTLNIIFNVVSVHTEE